MAAIRDVVEKIRPTLERVARPDEARQNVGGTERAISAGVGLLAAALGLKARGIAGLTVAGVGAALLHRAATGRCHLYQALGIDTTNKETQPEEYFKRGVHVKQSYTIMRGAEELYRFWRNFENLPRVMSHLESVQVLDDRRSHWVAKAPKIAGGSVEWDAEIINDEPNALIAWRSLPGADVPNTGSIRFVPAPGDFGTEVHCTIEYLPPAGQIGRLVAKMFGQEPQQQIREDLRNFKRIMEAGEIPTIQGQPRGTCNGLGERQVGW